MSIIILSILFFSAANFLQALIKCSVLWQNAHNYFSSVLDSEVPKIIFPLDFLVLSKLEYSLRKVTKLADRSSKISAKSIAEFESIYGIFWCFTPLNFKISRQLRIINSLNSTASIDYVPTHMDKFQLFPISLFKTEKKCFRVYDMCVNNPTQLY